MSAEEDWWDSLRSGFTDDNLSAEVSGSSQIFRLGKTLVFKLVNVQILLLINNISIAAHRRNRIISLVYLLLRPTALRLAV